MSFRKQIIIGLLGLSILLKLPVILFKQDTSYFSTQEGSLNPFASSETDNSSVKDDGSGFSPEVPADSGSDIGNIDIESLSLATTNRSDGTISHQDDGPEPNVNTIGQSPEIMPNQSKRWDTSIMITSNLIPTHPNIDMLQDTIYSLHKYLIGIPMDIPIYVVVDGLPEPKRTPDNEKREAQYIEAVRNGNFTPLTNVMVVPMGVHRNLAGSVKYTLETHVQTEFLYIIQHDLPFYNVVPHSKLLDPMRNHPDVLYNVRFRYNNKKNTRGSHCYSYHNKSDFPPEDFGGLDFFATNGFSDNNHLTTKVYYTYLLGRMKHHRRPMEAAVGWKARWNCTYWGQQIYGRRDDGQSHICHLNGRVSQSYNEADNINQTGWEKKAIWCRNQVYRELNETTNAP